jgi:multicomponent K+:H+ antiporter subunit E
MTTKLFPHPRFSLVLFTVWMLASNVLSVGTAVMAVVIAWAIPWFTRSFWPGAPRPKHPLLAFRLLLVFLADILVANFSVALRVIRSNDRLRPVFVEIPLDLTDDFGITILASMITLTPGTVSADVSPDKTHLFVHVLDCDDPKEIVDTIKRRYEAPLVRILQW